MEDLAKLGLQVESQTVEDATKRLHDIAKAAEQAEKATERYTLSEEERAKGAALRAEYDRRIQERWMNEMQERARAILAEERAEQMKIRRQEEATKTEQTYIKALEDKMDRMTLTAKEYEKLKDSQNVLTEAGRKYVLELRKNQEEIESQRGTLEKYRDMLTQVARALGFGSVANVLRGAGLVAAVVTVAEAMRTGISAELAFMDSTQRLNAMLDVTDGRVGRTTEELQAFAHALGEAAAVDQTDVQNAMTAVMQFGNVYGEQFEKVMKVAADMSEIQGNLASNSYRLARALEYPSRSLYTLRSMGILLTESERRLMRQLEESGRAWESREILIRKFEERYQGMAEKMEGSWSRAWRSLTVSTVEFLRAFAENTGAAAYALFWVKEMAAAMKILADIANMNPEGAVNKFMRGYELDESKGVEAQNARELARANAVTQGDRDRRERKREEEDAAEERASKLDERIRDENVKLAFYGQNQTNVMRVQMEMKLAEAKLGRELSDIELQRWNKLKAIAATQDAINEKQRISAEFARKQDEVDKQEDTFGFRHIEVTEKALRKAREAAEDFAIAQVQDRDQAQRLTIAMDLLRSGFKGTNAELFDLVDKLKEAQDAMLHGAAETNKIRDAMAQETMAIEEQNRHREEQAKQLLMTDKELIAHHKSLTLLTAARLDEAAAAYDQAAANETYNKELKAQYALIAEQLRARAAATRRKAEVDEVYESNEKVRKQMEDMKRLGEEMASAMGSAMEEVVFRGGNAGDVLQALGQDIVMITYRILILKPLVEQMGKLFESWGDSGGGGFGSLLRMLGLHGSTSYLPEGSYAAVEGGLAGSFAKGGIFGSGLPIRRFASGGIYTQPTALVAEAGQNEAVVPLPDGKSIPVDMRGGGGGGNKVTINVFEAQGTKTRVKQSQSDDGGMTLDVVVQMVEDVMTRRMERGKGLGAAIESRYSLTPTPWLVR